MSDSFLSAVASRTVDGAGADLRPAHERPVLGGRAVDAHGVNCGLLRCPRCFSRMVSGAGELTERTGADAILCVPGRQTSGPTGEEPEAPGEEAWEWSEVAHTWWWRVGGMDDVNNLGLSRVVTAPKGRLKLVMCVECNYGPFGYQLEDEAPLWLACDMLHQQDAALARDGDDFSAPPGIDMDMLQAMLASGMAIVQYHVSFDERVLGMQLTDAADGSGVVVAAFTVMDDGLPLPAERSGKIAVGDRVARVNGRSTVGLDYAAVLDRVREATRPVTIHFEHKGAPQSQQPAEGVTRIAHQAW